MRAQEFLHVLDPRAQACVGKQPKQAHDCSKAGMRAQEFCEGCDGQRQQVTRPAELTDNAALPAAFEARTGELILDGLQQGFRVRAPDQATPAVA
jgi:hypothetical protein